MKSTPIQWIFLDLEIAIAINKTGLNRITVRICAEGRFNGQGNNIVSLSFIQVLRFFICSCLSVSKVPEISNIIRSAFIDKFNKFIIRCIPSRWKIRRTRRRVFYNYSCTIVIMTTDINSWLYLKANVKRTGMRKLMRSIPLDRSKAITEIPSCNEI